jgi:replicative superfamily II helicase
MKVYSDLSNKDYHSLNSHISSSFIKNVAKHSVAKALEPSKPSPALLFGDAMHTYFEDKEAFHARFKVFKDSKIIEQIMEKRPDIINPSMTKEYKSYKNDFMCSLGEHQEVISEEDMEKIQIMYNSVIDNGGLKQVYNQVDHDQIWDEYSFVTDQEDLYGLNYRVRPDRLLVDSDGNPKGIIDWKSCRDASVKAFKSDFWRFRYDLQAVFYCEVLGVDVEDFYYVAIEKEFPYNTAVYSIDQETAMSAAKQLSELKQRIADWKKNPTQANIGLPNSNEIILL